MTSTEPLVFDTNVVVSALLFPESKPGLAFFQALRAGAVLISSPLMAELRQVLFRPKFDRYVSTEDRVNLLDLLIDEGTLVTVTATIQVCRDPLDNHILELAVSGGATCIVSGDRDLLVLDPFQGIRILAPDAFLAAHPPH